MKANALVVALFVLCNTTLAQDLESTYSKLRSSVAQPLTITGGINLAQGTYLVSGIDPRRDRFQWNVNANLNLNILGIDAPFSLAFSDGNQRFNLPSYTFTGISPHYKWATAHLGDRSMYFSKYTFSGINFRGAGVELRPGKLRVSGFYGQIKRANEEDLNSLQALDPSFRRLGYAGQIGYEDESQAIYLNIFGANDQENSIELPQNASIVPVNNLVVSVVGRKRLLDRLNLSVELAQSSLNRDNRFIGLDDDLTTDRSDIYGLFESNASVMSGGAIKGDLNYSFQNFNVSAGYERIGKDFRTLGSLFFRNDVELYSGGIFTSLLQNKINVNARIGIEQANFSNEEKTASERFVGSLNLTYAPSNRLYINGSYSNFDNTTRLRTLNDPLNLVDSIFLAQLTQSVNLSATYRLTARDDAPTLTLMLGSQNAESIVNDVIDENAKSSFFNGAAIYSYSNSMAAYVLNAAINFNIGEIGGLQTTTLSPSASITKRFLNNRLSAGYRFTLSNVQRDQSRVSTILNNTLYGRYRISSAHSLSGNITLTNRQGNAEKTNSFIEFYSRIQYNYSFGTNKRDE